MFLTVLSQLGGRRCIQLWVMQQTGQLVHHKHTAGHSQLQPPGKLLP